MENISTHRVKQQKITEFFSRISSLILDIIYLIISLKDRLLKPKFPKLLSLSVTAAEWPAKQQFNIAPLIRNLEENRTPQNSGNKTPENALLIEICVVWKSAQKHEIPCLARQFGSV